MILTVNTPHIAVPEEYRAGASTPGDSRLLPVVGTNRRDYGQVSGMAEPSFPFPAVNGTLPGANVTGAEACLQRLGPPLQLARLV